MSLRNREIQNKLTKELLDLIVLELLEKNPMHGYQLITSIRKNFGIIFGPSTIYPLLNTMEKKKFIKGEWDMSGEKPKKIYSVTSDGRQIISCTTTALYAFCRNFTLGNQQSGGLQDQIQVVPPNWNFYDLKQFMDWSASYRSAEERKYVCEYWLSEISSVSGKFRFMLLKALRTAIPFEEIV